MFRTQIYRLSRDIKYYVQDSLIVARKEEGVPSSLTKTTSTKGRLLRRAGVAYVQIFPPLFFILFHSPLHGGKKNSSIGVSERTGERGKRRTRGGKNGERRRILDRKGRERERRKDESDREENKESRKEREKKREGERFCRGAPKQALEDRSPSCREYSHAQYLGANRDYLLLNFQFYR